MIEGKLVEGRKYKVFGCEFIYGKERVVFEDGRFKTIEGDFQFGRETGWDNFIKEDVTFEEVEEETGEENEI